MNIAKTLSQTYKRYQTLRTHRITALPIVILMPHSACNCRCVMCDIWKDNKNLKQLTEADIKGLLVSLKKLGTQQVLMSGGEALLNPNFFRFCELLSQQGIRISLLSTGLTLKQHADQLVSLVSEIILSLDGDAPTHNRIRNIPDAFQKMQAGISAIRTLAPDYPISMRTVIHRLNFRVWPAIIDTAKQLGADHISFLPADVSSHAFNREVLWTDQRQQEVLPGEDELDALKAITEKIIAERVMDFESGFIAEAPLKLQKIHAYYAAIHGQSGFPYKKCNAPWVSAVVEADGTVRPCFFHPPSGNMHNSTLEEILNSEENIRFRKELDMDTNITCVKCVCYLNLAPRTSIN
jgi:Fe-coproporphyrin III synthase